MKLLMFYCPLFSSSPFKQTISEAEPHPSPIETTNAVVIFYHVEKEDEERQKKVLNKALKNIKWLANKFGTKKIVLHSFNHLSTSKSDPEIAREIIKEIKRRLEGVKYEVLETPFGWLNAWTMSVAGESLAKVFKDLT